MDDPRRDPRLMGPQPQLDMRRRRHRIAGNEKRHAPVSRGFEDLRSLFELLSSQDTSRLSNEKLQRLHGRPSQARGIEFREYGVRIPGGLEALDSDVLLIEQPEADEDELLHRCDAPPASGSTYPSRAPWRTTSQR